MDDLLKRIAEIRGIKPKIQTHEEMWHQARRKGSVWWDDEQLAEWESEGWVYDDSKFWRDSHTDNYCWLRELPDPIVTWPVNPLTSEADSAPLLDELLRAGWLIYFSNDIGGYRMQQYRTTPEGSQFWGDIQHEDRKTAIALAYVKHHEGSP